MNPELGDDALEFGRQAARALDAAGGDALAEGAAREPERRGEVVEPVLAGLGAWDLDPRGSDDELEAAAVLCRAAGRWSLPYPVAERLARPVDGPDDVAGLVVVGDGIARAAVGGLKHRWATVTLAGARGVATGRPMSTPPGTSAFVVELDVEPGHGAHRDDVALGLVLPCWTLLGVLDRALDVTRAHVRQRHQFGQPLASFQGVQFQLADAEVERAGVEELAKYALWSVRAHPGDAVADALAARAAAIEAAEVVFRVAHQLHGAIGFCDEAMVSWLSRYSQPLRRLPFGLSGTRQALTAALGRRGLRGLFDEAYAAAELTR